jgi:DNA-binding GntR family transcriptional regulator
LSPEQIAVLEHNLETQQECIQNEDVHGHVQADADFHLLLAGILGNAEIQKVMQHQRDKMFRITLQISRQNPARMQTSLAEHTMLFKEIRAGNGDFATKKIQAHLEAGKQYLLVSG